MNQATHAKKFRTLELQRTFDQFEAYLHEVSWLTHTRPVLCAAATILFWVTAKLFKWKHIKLEKTYRKNTHATQKMTMVS